MPKSFSAQKKCDWTDVRQAVSNNHGSIGAALFDLEKKYPKDEVTEAYEDYQAMMNAQEVEKAMREERSNAALGRGSDPKNMAILKANAEGIADQIRQGAKKAN